MGLRLPEVRDDNERTKRTSSSSLVSYSFLFWLGLVSYCVAILCLLSSWLSNSWVEDGRDPEYATIRGKNQPNEWTCDSLAAIFITCGGVVLVPFIFPRLLGRPASSLPPPAPTVGVPLSKAFSILCCINASVLASSACSQYESGVDRISATEAASGALYGASFLLMSWAALFACISAALLIIHEVLEYIRFRKHRTDPLYILRYSRRSRLGFHQRQFLHFLLLSLSLMFTGAWLYSFMEGWNMRLSLLFVAILLCTIGSSPYIPTTVVAQAFTMVFFPLGAACVLFTLQLCWKYILVGFLKFLPGVSVSDDPRDRSQQLKLTALFAICWLIFGSLVFAYTEQWNYWDSIWFSFATLVTIGFGDFFPQNPRSSLFLFLFVFIGFGSVASIMQNLATIYASNIRKEKIEREKKRRAKAAEKSARSQQAAQIEQNQSQGQAQGPSEDHVSLYGDGDGDGDGDGGGRAGPPAVVDALKPARSSTNYDGLLQEFEQFNSLIAASLPAEHVLDWQTHAEAYAQMINEKIQLNKETEKRKEQVSNSGDLIQSPTQSVDSAGDSSAPVVHVSEFLDGASSSLSDCESEGRPSSASEDEDDEEGEYEEYDDEPAEAVTLIDLIRTQMSDIDSSNLSTQNSSSNTNTTNTN